MGKRLLCLALCCVLLCGCAALAEDYVQAFDALEERDWYGTTTDEARIDMAWALLHIFRYAGYPVGGIAANDFAQAMNDQFDREDGETVWGIALAVLGQSLTLRGEAQYFPQHDPAYYQGLYEPDWYGSTTDDERIAMAWDILNTVRAPGYPVGGIADYALAQAMNDAYDQDKTQSVWDVALPLIDAMMPAWVLMPMDFAAEDAEGFAGMYEPDWYGDTSDAERVDMAWSLLNILRQKGFAIGHVSAQDFAQRINDILDVNKRLSVWEAALAVL